MLMRDHTDLPAIHASTDGMSHACLYSPATEHDRTLAGIHFAAGRRLSRSEWLVTYRDGWEGNHRSDIILAVHYRH